MSDFNAAQVLAEAYTLYKKHHDGMGLDFKIAIAQVREESEQRGAEAALTDFRRFATRVMPPTVTRKGVITDIEVALKRLSQDRYLLMGPLRADRLEGDDE